MSTIKTPQTVSHKGNGGHGFLTMLLIITWLVIAAGFYGVKIGSLQPDNTETSEKISALENKLSALDTRLSALEKRIAETSSVLQPVEGQNVPPADASSTQPNVPVTPVAPVNPAEPEANGIVTPPVDAPLVEPQAPENKNGSAPAKPQSNKDKNSNPNQTAIIEKKNYI